MTSRAITKTAVALAALALSGAAFSHAIWVQHTFGKDTIGFGHEGTDTDDYKASKIVKVMGHNTKGEAVEIATKDEGDHMSLELNNAAIVGAVMDNGYWAQNDKGEWINDRGDKVEGAKASHRTYKYTTHYANSRVAPKTLGLDLEIVPEVNPATLSKGDKLNVTVYYMGKPLEGATLDSNYFDQDKQSYKTDAAGKATVPVEISGYNIIEIGHKVKGDDPFEGKSMSSTLTFDSKSDHHH